MVTTKIHVGFDEETMKILEGIKGIGNKKAEKIRNIVLSWLIEKSYIKDFNRAREK